MHRNSSSIATLLLGVLIASACVPAATATPITSTETALPATPTEMPVTATLAPLGTPTVAPSATLTSTVAPTATETAVPVTATPTVVTGFCGDQNALGLIGKLKSVLAMQDGAALAALVDPGKGMAVQLYRNGKALTYDQFHAPYLFTSTYSPLWGNAPGSGAETVGSFHEVIIPLLTETLAQEYTIGCDQILLGGASYEASWPYADLHYFSVYYPGSDANGKMDWSTWLVGVSYVDNTPYIAALIHFAWEP